MTEAERQAWNAAVARGDTDEIEAMRDALLVGIHTRIMNDDGNYERAGWTPKEAA